MPRKSTSNGQNVIKSLHAYRSRLMDERSAIDGKLAALDALLGGSPAPRRVGRAAAAAVATRSAPAARGGRGPRKGSLKEYIGNVLARAGGVMSVRDITSGVLSMGFRTKNKTLAKSVGIALTEMRGVRKVGRGKFRLK
ncbi:MAG: hypothetical protein CHACPFDD_00700 [Phycisphaerae bacterium]|nr:hypothetical protein [Phycisphaerae bacterium]